MIGYRKGALPEIIDDAVEGLLVEPKNPIELADAILNLPGS